MFIHIMVLLTLKSGTAFTAACTVVKLQHPLRSTQRYEVVLVFGGGIPDGKSSQIESVFPPLGCFL